MYGVHAISSCLLPERVLMAGRRRGVRTLGTFIGYASSQLSLKFVGTLGRIPVFRVKCRLVAVKVQDKHMTRSFTPLLVNSRYPPTSLT